jgi:beta-glucosidase/6-phospho-beta-glucosidase/beta-galactosidase
LAACWAVGSNHSSSSTELLRGITHHHVRQLAHPADNICAALLLATVLLQDLPQVLQDKYGGFLSPQIQADFLYYADMLFRHLGDIVDQWMTFNEVISICELGYQVDVFAPQANKGLGAKYTCGHNVLLAHAKTMQLYRWDDDITCK